MQAIGIDVGGTKIAGLLVGSDGAVLDGSEVPTPAEDPEGTMAAMISMAQGLRTDAVRAVGVGAAGLVEVATGTLRYAPNLAWRELPIAEKMSQALNLPCVVDNDATAAAWGEFRFGAGRDYDHMLLVAVGTGIGGGIVSDGKLFRGAHGFAAEIGHIIVEPDGPRCGCGNLGCWEQVAGGQAIDRLGKEAARENPNSLVSRLAGGDPERANGRIVTRAGKEGDGVARLVLATVGRRLGEGIGGLVNVLDPQIVVVGGGVMEADELILEPARAAYAEAVEALEHRPAVPIVAAALGNEAGAVGAATLALEEGAA